MSSGDDRRMLRQPEVVIRRERHDGSGPATALVDNGAGRAAAIEVPCRPPPTGGGDGLPFVRRPVLPARHEAVTSTMASARAVTMRSISSAVVVNGGIS